METFDFLNNMSWTWYIVFFTILFSLIGFVRNRIDNKGPGVIVDVKGITDLWLAEPSWVSRFSLLFIPFGYIINFLGWVVFGIFSIYDFFAFLVKVIWWILAFIWNEIFYPGIVTIFRLFWHYLINFAFQFFKFSFNHIKTSYSERNLFFSVKYLFLLALIPALGLIFYSLIPSLIVLGLFIVLTLFWYQFISLKAASFFKNDSIIENNLSTGMQLSFVWFLVLSISSSILFLFFSNNAEYLYSAFGMLATQVVVPVSFLLFVAFISVASYLPSFISGNSNAIQTGEFLKSIFFRFPKLIYAQIFQLPAFFLVGIIPFLIFYFLDLSTLGVSGKNFNQWFEELTTIGDHIPDNKIKKRDILSFENKSNEIEKEIIGLKNSFDSDISNIDSKIKEAEALKDNIKDYSIHSYAGDFYVGETQFFSVPFIVECSEYKWRIEQNGKIINQLSVPSNSRDKSILIRNTWNSPGNYKISLLPSNICGNSPIISRSVNILERPRYRTIQNPTGKTRVCEGDELVYRTEQGFDSYEWRHPFGEVTTNKNEINIIWGNSSGTVQVRGKYQNRFTPWKGIDVFLQPLPNQTAGNGKFREDELMPPFKVDRDFVFQTRELAQDSIQKLNTIKSQIREEFDKSNTILKNQKIELSNKIKNTQSLISRNKRELIGKYIAIFGFTIVFSLLVPPFFIFATNYNFDLFEFKQSGDHYYQNIYKELNGKNPNQPYLAIFILISLFGLIYFIKAFI